MLTRHSLIKMIVIGAIIAVLLLFGLQFLRSRKGGVDAHYYQITVNNETYTTAEIKIDSVANRITFQNMYGGQVTAPLDRTVILKFY